MSVLQDASDRQRLLLVRSEYRIQRLYTVGTWLIVLSVIVPFGLVAIYSSVDTIGVIQALAKAGVSLDTAAELARRDWHLLVAGVSFGLLFVAAAKGIFSAEARHRDMYFALSQRVSYCADMANVVGLAEQLDLAAGNAGATSQEAVRQVIAQLMCGVKEQSAQRIPTVAPARGDDGTPDAMRSMAALMGKHGE